MKILSLYCFFIFITFTSGLNLKAQSIRFKPEVNIGIAFRNASLELSNYPNRNNRSFGFDFDQIALTRTQNLALDIGQFVYKKRIYVDISSYLRYGHFHYETQSPQSKEIKRLKYDFFLDASYYFKKKNENRFGVILGAGIGYMNINTGFRYNYINGDTDASGNYVVRNVKGGFGYIAPRLIVGGEIKRIKGFVIVHGTPDDDYRSNPTIWLEFKLSYKIFKFK
jgi:hypothetical protein